MTAVLLQPEHRWECPNCQVTEVTHEPHPHVRMHTCKGLRGITAPMVAAGTRCKVFARERDDYLNGDIVTRDGANRPIMSVVTVRDDGQDAIVFAPAATASLREYDLPNPVSLLARFRQLARRARRR